MTEKNGAERSTATDVLRRMLDERGVEYEADDDVTRFFGPDGFEVVMQEDIDGKLDCLTPLYLTPAQAIAATLGSAYEPPMAMHWNGDVLALTIPRDPSCIRVQRSAEQPCKVYADESKVIAATLGPTYKPNPVWEKWHKSLRHETVETVGDAVEQLMYEAIEFGGDMGPNGNTCNGIDEGDVLTSGFINEWIARFESTLGRDRYSYEQLREISNAVGDAMEYAHDRAIEHPDRADPLWSLDEYVNRILKVAFEGEATLGATDARPTQAESSGTCQADETDTIECVCDGIGNYGKKLTVHVMECTECGHVYEHVNGDYEFCPRCGRKVVTNG